MDFSFNEDQLAVRSLAEQVFTDLCSDDSIKTLSHRDAPSAMHKVLWLKLAELGLLGSAIDKRHGGMGMGLPEFCLILEQQGRTLAPLPLMATYVECAMTLADGDNPKLKQSLLPDVATGEHILSPVRPYRGLHGVQALQFTPDADAYTVHGRGGFSAYAGIADGYIVGSEAEHGSAVLAYLPSDTPGISVTEQRAVNDEAGGYLTFAGVRVEGSDIIAQGAQAVALLRRQRQRAWVAVAALQIGILDEGLKRAASYVSERKQFGRRLGEFQAVSQQAADAYMEIESLRGVYWRALEDIERGHDFAISAAVAKHWAGIAAHKTAHTFLHLHGGLGQDLDYPIHRYFLWAKQYERYLGTGDALSLQVGDALISRLDRLVNES